MAIIKNDEIKRMENGERNIRIKELKLELVKTQIAANKSSKLKPKDIKKTIARLLTFNRLNTKSIEK